ncbi:MAG: hypothetical protein H0X51_03340 [Parachlamydiaceae bacterium]|nr:hypothetical protein [Parachlamydiaceae bacterium]
MEKKLKEYSRKRTLALTPEPTAKRVTSPKAGSLLFVIHKHNASHLHYDLRLELNGVLKSWAVPKGPSLNPEDKRLAIMVEDHPYDYHDFEGIIPAGNYGAGSVIIWDEGTYAIAGDFKTRKEMEKAIQAKLEKGHLDFIFFGKKLKGEFSLVHFARKEEPHWLLIKKKDKFASTSDVIKKIRSVRTEVTNADLEMGKTYKPKKKVAIAKIPHNISPMLCTLVEEPFDRKNWIFEIKWDGYRALTEIENGHVKIYSRNQQSFNARFPSIVAALETLPVKNAVLDGEIVVLDSEGRSRFQLMQNEKNRQRGALCYCLFDLLFLDGKDLRQEPLIERKKLLKGLLKQVNLEIRYSDHIKEKGEAFFRAAVKNQLEGIVAKDGDSTYQMKRSKDWLKIKVRLRQEVVIGGFTQPRGSRKNFGSLLAGVYEGKKLRFVGHVGVGFNQQSLQEIYEKLVPLIQKKSPFDPIPKEPASVQWVKPVLVCEVSFAEWTDEGVMRQPKGLLPLHPARGFASS